MTVVAQRHQPRSAVADAITEIGIVLYPGVQAACVHGLTDLFEIAANIARDQQRDGRSPLRVTHWRPAHNRDTKLSCVYDSDPRGSSQPQILIIPPTMVDLPDPGIPIGVVSWLRSHYAGGTKLASVCSGAFILAETGLVAGRTVSTHRICAELAKRFPEITIDTNQRIIDDGDIITAGGFLAWVDVGLLLVDRLFGGAVRAETARFVLSDPAASESPYFPGFAPRQTHGDTAVLKPQEWVHIRDGRDVSLAAMAGAAGLEKRTFLRRFANATGMTRRGAGHPGADVFGRATAIVQRRVLQRGARRAVQSCRAHGAAAGCQGIRGAAGTLLQNIERRGPASRRPRPSGTRVT